MFFTDNIILNDKIYDGISLVDAVTAIKFLFNESVK